jgi:uncharacterized protein UPF0158
VDFAEWRAQMRGAVYWGDGPIVVGLLSQNGAPAVVLQLAGEGLLAAVAQGVEGAADFAAFAVKGLRDRAWTGDEELADHLEGMLGTAAMPSLRPLPVDLEELTGILEGDPLQSPGRVDLETGEVWPDAEIEYAETVGEAEPRQWLWVNPQGSQDGYDDMALFISGLTHPGLQAGLQRALESQLPFRHFEDVLAEWPGEREHWHAFADDRRRGRARSWLAAAGYCQAPPARPRVQL